MKTTYGLESFLRFLLAVWGAVLFFGLFGHHNRNECVVTGYWRDNHISGYGGYPRYEWIPYSNDFVLRQLEFHNDLFVATLFLGLFYFTSRLYEGQNKLVVRMLLFYTFLASLFWSIQIFIRCGF